jgi:hypothetical protein
LIDEEVVTAKAGVALATLRIEDPERRPATRRPIPVARDQCLRPLPDDIASEADPRTPGKLEAEPRRLGDGRGQTSVETGRFEDDEERLRASGERRQPGESIGDAGLAIRGGQPAPGKV